VAFWVSLIAANTTTGGCEIRNLRLRTSKQRRRCSASVSEKIGSESERFRSSEPRWWAVERLLDQANKLGSTKPEHYLIPRRLGGKQYDPTQPPSRWGWRTAWRKLTEEARLEGLRPHDLLHHAISRLAESPEASEQTIMAIAGHVSREMLEHYSHVRQEAKRRALESLDNDTITSQFAKWEALANQSREPETQEKKNNEWSGRADLNCRPLAPQAALKTQSRSK